MAGLVVAFKSYHYEGGLFGSPWVGFDNFRYLFISDTIYRLTVNTIMYNVAFIAVSMALQITAAIFLSEIVGKWFRKITQSFLFFPYFISYVLLGAFVYNIFNYEFGILNSVLKAISIEPFDAYGAPSIWKFILVFFYCWKWIGYGAVIYLAAILNINGEYYEAAKIDGANIFQQIRHITIPQLMPTIAILFLFKVGMIMKGHFDLFYQIIGDNSMLYNSTDVIDTFVFRALVRNFDIGMGSAAGLYQSIFGLVIVFTVNAVVKRLNREYALF